MAVFPFDGHGAKVHTRRDGTFAKKSQQSVGGAGGAEVNIGRRRSQPSIANTATNEPRPFAFLGDGLKQGKEVTVKRCKPANQLWWTRFAIKVGREATGQCRTFHHTSPLFALFDWP